MSSICVACNVRIPEGQGVPLPTTREKRIDWANGLGLPSAQMADRTHNSRICVSHFEKGSITFNPDGSVKMASRYARPTIISRLNTVSFVL